MFPELLWTSEPKEGPSDCLGKRGGVQEALHICEDLKGIRRVTQSLGLRSSPCGESGADGRNCWGKENREVWYPQTEFRDSQDEKDG